AGGVAHDFNNMLTVINGYCHLISMQLSPNDPLLSKVEEINKAGERAASLTRQLLIFSRKQILQPKILDLNLIISEIEKMLRRLIGENIEFRTILDSQVGSVKADPGQIEQTILNLVVNARDAMPEGGKLLIETKNIYLDEDYVSQHIGVKSGYYIMLAVSDSGIGMDAETQSHIFEPFYTTKEVGRGTGLGLSTVYGIVRQSGGSIWVYSEPGKGTTFKVYLPRVDEIPQAHKSTTANNLLMNGTETILLVEDEKMVRKITCEILESCGYEVFEAENGSAAFLLYQKHKQNIQLLITDVILPEMNGSEIANRLLQINPELKVLYMSGYTDNAIVNQGIFNEGINFIEKPFSPDKLRQKVRDILDGNLK
ncbi:MAG TPA: ATP-binding protein, partial [Pyrinomonadaceae bacterium]|nr:ATP-binding protein [Pyrinomonadaceae bacterium]